MLAKQDPPVGRRLWAILAFGFCACIACLPCAALAQDVRGKPLQIYGLTLDETRIDEPLCEASDVRGVPTYPEGHICLSTKHGLPRISGVRVTEFPAPSAVLTFDSISNREPETLAVWYAPRALGGQSFLISTTTHDPRNLDLARDAVLQSLGEPTAEFTPADLEAKGMTIFDLNLDTMVFVDPTLPEADRSRIVARIQKEFDPAADELLVLTESSLQTLARLLGSDFRGGIVQIGESGFGHQSYVTTILLDLKRAGEVFEIAAE
jgi:hypothetical protein